MFSIVMSCYNPKGSPRGDYAVESARSLFRHLYIDDDCEMVIADDGSESTSYYNDIYNLNPRRVRLVTGERKGIGSSLNRALKTINNSWMYTTDDWVLTGPLDLTLGRRLFRRGYDVVRIGPIHPNLRCVTRFDEDWWLDIDPTYGFAFSTRPFMATKTFYDKIGPFLEGVNAYDNEQDYSLRVAKSDTKIAYLGNISMVGPWEHIGEYEVGEDTP